MKKTQLHISKKKKHSINCCSHHKYIHYLFENVMTVCRLHMPKASLSVWTLVHDQTSNKCEC